MTQVTSPAGTFLGVENGSTSTFYSIEYCQATPFEAPTPLPTPPADTTTVIDATVPKAHEVALTVTCPTPIKPLADAPVVVFIHGGRYEEGSHDGSWYQGQAFAESGCVYVSVGYRLKLDGWATFHDDKPGHYRGVQDCQLALEWIQKNIEAFGGDPTNVTLMGQSAGAAIALWLARKDHYRGAFRRIVACSPGFPRQPFQARKGFLRTALGKPITREQLQRTPQKKLEKAYRAFRWRYITDPALGPYLFDATELADIPILLTHMRDEFYNDPIAHKLDALHLATPMAYLLAQHMGISNSPTDTRVEKTKRYLARAREIDKRHIAARMVGDSTIRRWVAETAEHAPGKVWLLEFVGNDSIPALHCAELPLLFRCLDVRPDRVHKLLPHAQQSAEQGAGVAHVADVLHHEIVRFAHNAAPEWDPYTTPEREERTLSLVDGSWGNARNPLYGVIDAWVTDPTPSA